MLLGLSLIPIIFYTYNGVIGKSPDWINIAIFFISAAAVYIYEARRLSTGAVVCRRPLTSISILLLIAILFTLFSFYAPKIDIFKDPLTNSYGI